MKYNCLKGFFLAAGSIFTIMGYAQPKPDNNKPVWQTPEYTIYPNRVIQGSYEATVISSTEINSNYKSPVNVTKSPRITFRFSINGKDNELKPGINHHFNCVAPDGKNVTPLIKFGEVLDDKTPIPSGAVLAPNTSFTIRLDMRPMIADFKSKGYFTTFNGDRIYKEDFKAIYVAGDALPLTWDFDNLYTFPALKLHDDDGDGIYEVTLTLNVAKEEKQTATKWQLSKDLSACPQYRSDYPVSDAVYKMAMEEMLKAVEPDSTFRTGAEWAGVWTRDISYSIILSMSYMQPAVSKYSLMRKVKNGKIIQDTGTGGAYPVSTDRMVWAVAAWEIYKATGDKDWLKQSYEIIKNSIDQDLANIYDETGLVKGESSFLDWREQTYPKWMRPADIYASECLGTNAVHFQANTVLSEMAKLLGNQADAQKYAAVANKIKMGMNTYLWMPDKKYYAQYRYGRNNQIVSPRSEALGEALCVLFNIADNTKQQQIAANVPVTAYGISCIYPQIPNIPPYHNNGVWPFVQSYWMWANAKAGNEKGVIESIAAIYRPAALFLTNKENFVADNGDFASTQINSSNMLWSLCGNLSIVHKVLFGMNIDVDGISFSPFVPKNLEGKRSLTNFKYRNAVLNIEMQGYGNKIKSFIIDGRKYTKPVFPATLKGTHTVKIILANNSVSNSSINKVPNYFTIQAPSVTLSNNMLQWDAVEGASSYKVLKNGQSLLTTTSASLSIQNDAYSEYQVIAIDKNGVESFASEPVVAMKDGVMQQFEMEKYADKAGYKYKGASSDGFIEISTTNNTTINIPVVIKEDGVYAIDFRYSNGNGPSNTSNKCAIRTFSINKQAVGTFIFPQRGNEEWSNWGFSNIEQVTLKKGNYNFTLTLQPANENMNGDVNQAMLDYMRVIKIK